jgi:hypothetical protein
MKYLSTLLVLGVLFSQPGCRRDAEELGDTSSSFPESGTFTLSAEVSWANTGIELAPGQRIKITPKSASREESLGFVEADFSAPVPTAGSLGLIAKFGEKGLPVAVGEGIELQAPSDRWGEYLFLGRNGKLTDYATSDTAESARVLQPIEVVLEVSKTSAPAPMAPVNGFFTANASPTFDWDDVENALKYVFELSRFPDFRDQVIALELSTGSSVSLANFRTDPNSGQPTIPGQEDPAATLTEGIYFWRVRSQVNLGRTIAPVLDWTDHSPVSWFGIETRRELPEPRVLSPVNDARFQAGQTVLLEITQTPDASGLFWRYKGYAGDCGTTLDTLSGQELGTSPWFVFRNEYQSNFLGEIPQRYEVAELKGLESRKYLYEIEVVDGADGSAISMARAGRSQVSFSIGCQN